MMKHAYLIMAFNNAEQLKILLSMIDDERNDIYLHIDLKSNMNIDDFKCEKATLNLINRIKVYWGGYSQIKCELLLLSEATKTKHSYYHLISGQDLPIKSQGFIHQFFKNLNYEFIRFENKDFLYEDRVKYFYFFTNFIGKPKNTFCKLLIILEKLSVKIQRKIGINRIKNFNIDFQKGSNWFSITHELANYVLSNEEKIKKFINTHYVVMKFSFKLS